MTTMFDNLANRDLLRLLTKSLLMLEISDDPVLRKDLIASADRMLEQTLELKTERNLSTFKQSLEGNHTAEQITFSSTARPSTFDEIATGEQDDRNTEEGNALNADRSIVGEMDKSVHDQTHASEMDNSVHDQSHVSEAINATGNTSPIIESAAHQTSAHDTTASSSTSSLQSPPSKRPTSKRRNKPVESSKISTNKSTASKTPTSKTPISKTPTTKTPTTYGLNNSTQTRNLRKSMHTQRLSVTNEVSRKQTQSARRANERSGNRAALSQQQNYEERGGNIEAEDSSESDKEVISHILIAK